MLKTILPIGLIVGFRFFGLFIVLPVLSIYVLNFGDNSAVLVGLAIGIYAISQMVFQIPFGIASDKFGRKIVIAVGLLIFIAGSLVCFLADDMYIFIFGRFLQGLGAISGVASAFVTDIIKEEQRAKGMAIIGSLIALSFMLAMFLSPILSAYYEVNYLFLLVVFLGIASLYILLRHTPNTPQIQHSYSNKPTGVKSLLDSRILIMSLTNFLQKLFLSIYFVIIPIVLTKTFNWQLNELWMVYTPSIFLGILAMGGGAFFAEAKMKFKAVLAFGIICFAASFVFISFSLNQSMFIIGVFIFFIGFNVHEPIMQSLVTKYIKAHQRGFIISFFNSCGYFGTFIGAILGATFALNFSQSVLFSLIIFLVCIAWLFFIYILQSPARNKNLYLPIKNTTLKLYTYLDDYKWCKDWYINNNESILIVKYDSEQISQEEAIKRAIK